MVDGRGVAEVLREVRAHGLKNLGQYRGCRVIVEIDSAHGTHALFYARSAEAKAGGPRHAALRAQNLASIANSFILTGLAGEARLSATDFSCSSALFLNLC